VCDAFPFGDVCDHPLLSTLSLLTLSFENTLDVIRPARLGETHGGPRYIQAVNGRHSKGYISLCGFSFVALT